MHFVSIESKKMPAQGPSSKWGSKIECNTFCHFVHGRMNIELAYSQTFRQPRDEDSGIETVAIIN
jgi:hypothetical protein